MVSGIEGLCSEIACVYEVDVVEVFGGEHVPVVIGEEACYVDGGED